MRSTLLTKTLSAGTSLVAQWLRIHLPMQGTWVRALVWEDPTCCRAAKPMHHSYRACALEPMLRNKRSHRNKKPMPHKDRAAPSRRN